MFTPLYLSFSEQNQMILITKSHIKEDNIN